MNVSRFPYDPVLDYVPGDERVFIPNERLEIGRDHYTDGSKARDLSSAYKRFMNGGRAAKIVSYPEQRWLRMEVSGRYTYLSPENAASVAYLLNEMACNSLRGHWQPTDWLTRLALKILRWRGNRILEL